MKPSVWMAVPLNLAPVGPQAFYTSDERLASEWAYNGYDGHQVTVTGMVSVDEARAAIAELIEADREFDAAHHDWEHVTAHDPQETSDEDWRRIADRFEAATMRRIAALARVGGDK